MILSLNNKCRCQSGSHGHQSGACQALAVTEDHSHDRVAAEAMGWFMPLSEPVRGVGITGVAASGYAGSFDFFAEPVASRPVLSVESIIIPERTTHEGTLIRATTLLFDDIVLALGNDWSCVLDFTPEQWEQIVGGGYEVIVTRRSGDFGVDVIARRHGFGAVKLLGSVKRNAPGRLVPAADVRELMGALNMDQSASKGMLITTSDFAPRILDDLGIANAIPTRLELINGEALQKLLTELDRG